MTALLTKLAKVNAECLVRNCVDSEVVLARQSGCLKQQKVEQSQARCSGCSSGCKQLAVPQIAAFAHGTSLICGLVSKSTQSSIIN